MANVTAKRFNLEEYHRLTDLGFFQPTEHIELIQGELIQMVAKGTAHEVCLTRLLRELPKCLGDQVTLRCQSPIILPPHSEPEPDFAVVRNQPDDYLDSHPLPNDVLLLIEISDSSITYDQDIKLPLYAEQGILHYWIFNLLDALLECYSDPYQRPQGLWAYRNKRIFLPNETVSFPLTGIETELTLPKVFPPQR